MKLLVSSLAYSIAVNGLLIGLQQVQFDVQWLTTLLQVPMVAGLIVLVLKLEDKRQASAMVREETFRTIVDSLLGAIMELSSVANPDKVPNDLQKSIDVLLASQRDKDKR